MRLILTGCEYAGTTTLVNNICAWLERAMGTPASPHDHFKFPHLSHASLTAEEQEQLLGLSPLLKEQYQRYHVDYHVGDQFYREAAHHIVVGLHFDEAVYAPLYYGYGGVGAPFDRRLLARQVESRLMEVAPDTVVVLVKASAEVIAQRMREAPHPHGLLREEDIEAVLERFEDDYRQSVLRHKFVLDTSEAAPEETLAEFQRQVGPFLSDGDRLRLLTQARGGVGRGLPED